MHPVVGDLREPKLGVDPGWIDAHRGKIDHFFHLAAIYDMTAADEINEALNVGGTRAARRRSPTTCSRASCTTSPRSPSPARTRASSARTCSTRARSCPSPYHRTKFESERIVREGATVPWRVYRPAIVVGDSRTGEMDKIDGPYYFFKAIQRRAQRAARSGSR